MYKRQAFEEAGFRPGILFESVSTRTVVNMVRQQIGPAFFPQAYVEPEAPIAYFSVRPRQTWMRCMAYLKGCYLTKPEKYYIELATRYVPVSYTHLDVYKRQDSVTAQSGYCFLMHSTR